MKVPLHIAALALFQGQHGSLNGASPQANNTAWLYWVIFWICFGAFVLVVGGFAIGGSKDRLKPGEPLPLLLDTAKADRTATWWVGSAIATTVLALFSVLALSAFTEKSVETISAKNPVTIKITGHQWWWEVHYPSVQPDQTVTTANEIHIPVGRPIVILTESADVIHSFWVPNLSGKRDLLPGYSSAMWFKVNKPGVYHGQCAEFCGLQHAHMGFAVIAEPEAKFEAWSRDQLKSGTQPATPEEARGQQVFLTHACVLCHTIQGTDANSHYGPDLTHVGSRESIAAETLLNTPGNLAGWISDPQRIKPGNKMAPNPMSGPDLEALVTYLESLR